MLIQCSMSDLMTKALNRRAEKGVPKLELEVIHNDDGPAIQRLLQV